MPYIRRLSVSRRSIGFAGPIHPVPPVLPTPAVIRRSYGLRASDNPHYIANPTELKFQAISLTKRGSGAADVAQITIPNARDNAATVTALADNLLQIYRTNHRVDGSSDEEIIEQILISGIDLSYGARSSSILLNCESTYTRNGDRSWTAEGVSYAPYRAGRYVVRGRIIPKLIPGDELTFGATTFTVRYATFVISHGGSIWMEAGE